MFLIEDETLNLMQLIFSTQQYNLQKQSQYTAPIADTIRGKTRISRIRHQESSTIRCYVPSVRASSPQK